ncbi:MAG: hypothetical protein GOMPHAMPRED_005792 [Gomphillus americanus]|uniref:Roadblock/LAMTOR2 domain-containing protein n=1 Tax=Gomphillus americanus TaxID=1940652 RepID=A0A8H3FUK9_9LECA|nr:MAG: hypothetical protein GOMPHAMPRED_005792 [Gomphillus americanus]
MSQPTNATLEHLTRIATKPGVRSTLILSKTDGAIIQSTGLISASQKESSETGQEGYQNAENQKSAEEVAKMAYDFVRHASSFAIGMQDEDDVQLLRLRTRKNEIVIVPDAKYLLVVIHDAPKAG